MTEIADLHLLDQMPKCFRVALFGGQRLIMHTNCPEHTNPDGRWAHLALGPFTRWDNDFVHGGRQVPYPCGDGKNDIFYADTAEEAERLYAEACEWLRMKKEG